MSHLKTHVRKGDLVEVITGDHKGAQGTVLLVQPEKGRVLVEGVRMIKKTVRPSQQHQNGGIIEKEGPIHISNVKLADKPKKAPAKKTVAKKKKTD
jgi:large subunit ribosomal protein L24